MLRLGIDLGGTNIAVGAVDAAGVIVAKKSAPTLAKREHGLIIDDIVALCLDVCKEAGCDMEAIASVGIAVPGGVDEKSGEIIFTPNIPFSGLNIAEILSKRFDGKRVGVVNDANAALLAEIKCGAAVGYENAVMITIGTGIGGAIAINGRILSGINGMAGELGHIVIKRGGKPCSCGRQGCFETYASATALVNLTKQEIESCKKTGEYTLMADTVEINARVAFDAYKQGDAAAKRVLDEYIDALSGGIISLINIFQPDVLLIGGGVSGEKQFLIDLLAPYIDKEDYARGVTKRTRIATALCGNGAGIIGAAFA